METYTIVDNTLLFRENAKTMTEAQIQAAFDHLVQVVMKRQQQDSVRQRIVRENAEVFNLDTIWNKKTRVSFGPCHVYQIPKKNNGLKVPSR